MERKDILTVAIDAARGTVAGKYTKGETSESIRQAFIELNGGSTKINPKTFYRGTQLFELVQELLPVIIEEGFKENDFLMGLVDYRNIAYGDVNEFVVKGEAVFVVADAAAGIQGVRRQRIGDGDVVRVKTSLKIARVYENLGRFLANRVDYYDFVDGVSKAFANQILHDAYTAIEGISSSTAGLGSDYVKTGDYDAGVLLGLIDHVEAATGKVARVYGTRGALIKVTDPAASEDGKSDKYNIGHFGKFMGTDLIRLRQGHKPGTSNFMVSDKRLFVIAGDDKPIKVVNEGTGLLIEKDAAANADLTQEYIYAQAYGVGAIASEKIGVFILNN